MKTLSQLVILLCAFGLQVGAVAAKYRVEHSYPHGGPFLGKETIIRFSLFRGSETIPLTAVQLQVEHEKLIHMMTVDSGFQQYLHEHPKEITSGVWEVPVTLTMPGAFRFFLQFLPEEEITTKTVMFDDLYVNNPGDQVPSSPVHPNQNFKFVDGEFSVTVIPIAGFEPKQKQITQIYFRIEKNGIVVPFKDLDPFLGAGMHLAGISADKNDFVHAHPGGGDPGLGADPEEITKMYFQKAGYYGLFMQYNYKGVIHTNQFTLNVKP